MRSLLILSGLFGSTAVILGALGAHALSSVLTETSLASFKTGVLYHLVHAFIFLGLIPLKNYLSKRVISILTWQFSLGILLFSWSIYVLATKDIHGLPVGFLGPVTPIGGIILISSWINLAIQGFKIRPQNL